MVMEVRRCGVQGEKRVLLSSLYFLRRRSSFPCVGSAGVEYERSCT